MFQELIFRIECFAINAIFIVRGKILSNTSKQKQKFKIKNLRKTEIRESLIYSLSLFIYGKKIKQKQILFHIIILIRLLKLKPLKGKK